MFKFFLDAADAAADTQATSGGSTGGLTGALPTILMLVVMVAIFYFLLIRPQKKQEKEAQNMRDSLSVGDEITTIGGIIGEIVSIIDENITIETSKAGTKMRLLKSAVRSVDVSAADKKKALEE